MTCGCVNTTMWLFSQSRDSQEPAKSQPRASQEAFQPTSFPAPKALSHKYYLRRRDVLLLSPPSSPTVWLSIPVQCPYSLQPEGNNLTAYSQQPEGNDLRATT